MKKRGQAWDFMIPLLIAIGVLVLVFVIYGVITGKLGGIGSFIKDLIRFGR